LILIDAYYVAMIERDYTRQIAYLLNKIQFTINIYSYLSVSMHIDEHLPEISAILNILTNPL
jgi:hypothetical protein